MSLLSLKHIHTYSPDKITLRNDTPIMIGETQNVTQWFLPSKDELLLMYTNLCLSNIGNFRTTGGYPNEPKYWSSTEGADGRFAVPVNFSSGGTTEYYKQTSYYVRATRILHSSVVYNIGDETDGGFIYFIKDNGDGTFDYYEAAKTDCASKSIWSNLYDTSGSNQLYFIGTTSSTVNSGIDNTNKIIGQSGHTTSAALIATNYGLKTIHNYINSITADLFIYNTTTKVNTSSINILNKLYTNARSILFTKDSSIIADSQTPHALQSYVDSTKTTYVKHVKSQEYGLINSVVDNEFAVLTSDYTNETETLQAEFYTPEFYITKADLGLSSNIPSNVYTLKGTIVYANSEEEDFELNIIYYASIAVCIRQKLNEFVLDCNQCRNTDDVVPFFIAESAFQSLQYYEEGPLDVTAINKIMSSLNIFCNQKTCTTC